MAKKAKTEKFHTEAEQAVYTLLDSVIDKNHRHFRDSEFLILFKHGGWMSRGRTAFARFKVLADDMRRTLDKDAVLYLNCDVWRKMTEPQQRYFLDEALLGLDFKTNAKGDELTHPGDGRSLLKLVPPDVEAYLEAIRRHGPIAEDVKRLIKGLKEVSQLSIEDVQDEQPAPPHEGVTGKIGEGGVVESVDYDERNQLTLEQAAAAAEAAVEEATRNHLTLVKAANAADDDPMHDQKEDLPFSDPPADDDLEDGDQPF